MAYCHGPDSPYGCGHHAEHVGAARKGWHSRQGSAAFLHSEQASHLSRMVGPVEALHRHRRGRQGVFFRQHGAWFELREDEFSRMLREGRKADLAERRQREQEEAEYRRGQRTYERQLARMQRQDERDAARRAREEKRRASQAAAEQRHQEAIARAMERAELQEVRRHILKAGGIRRVTDTTGRMRDRGELETLPHDLMARRRAAAHQSVTLDEAATAVHQHMPWLGLETPRDLLDYFDRVRTRRQQRPRLGLAS